MKKNLKKYHDFFLSADKRKTHSGFSLLETTLTMSIISLAAAAGLLTFREARDRSDLYSAEAAIVHSLETARNRSATGVGNTNHGVHMTEKEITIFAGDSFIGNNGRTMILPPSISTDQNDKTILFKRLSATTTASTIIISNQRGRTVNISINKNGSINPGL